MIRVSRYMLLILLLLAAGLTACGANPTPTATATATATEITSPLPTPGTVRLESPPPTPTPEARLPQRDDQIEAVPTLDPNQPTPTPEARLPQNEATLDPALLASSPLQAQSVSLTTADEVTLAATFYPLEGEGHPALLLLHMFARDKDTWADFARQAQEAGYVVLAIDLRGHGDSEGRQDEARRMDADVTAGLAWLKNAPEVDAARISVVGASVGANLALRAGADDEAVQAVVLMSPGLTYQGLSVIAAREQYGSRPLLMLVSEADGYSASSVRDLSEPPLDSAQVEVYDGSAHGTDLFKTKFAVGELILTWLSELE